MLIKIQTSILYFILFAFITLTTRIYPQTYKYFFINDGRCKCDTTGCTDGGRIVAGDQFTWLDHLDYTTDRAQWCFVPTDCVGCYGIQDRYKGSYLYDWPDPPPIMGVPSSCTIQFTPPPDRKLEDYPRILWRIEPVDYAGRFRLQNMGTEYYLLAPGGIGEGNNNYVLVTNNPGNRSDATWWLQLAHGGEGDIGPDFYVVKQELLDITLDRAGATSIDQAPLFAIDQVLNNNTDYEQTSQIEARKTEIVTETWEFQSSVTVGLAMSMEVSGGVPGVVTASAKTEVSMSASFSYTNGISITRESEYVWTIPVTIPGNKSVRVTATIGRKKSDVPFSAVVATTLGDNNTRIDTVNGKWKGIDYLTGEVNYEIVTDIQEMHYRENPISFELFNNYPNPFNANTKIQFQLPEKEDVSLEIFNFLGEKVKVLTNKENLDKRTIFIRMNYENNCTKIWRYFSS